LLTSANHTGVQRRTTLKAMHVLLSGGSAGGIGTLYNVDYLAAQLPAATVKAAPNAGWFFPYDHLSPPHGLGTVRVFRQKRFVSRGVPLRFTPLLHLKRCHAACPMSFISGVHSSDRLAP
jgi:hypothetical protein